MTLKALQESADRNRDLYKFEEPNADLLETFESPVLEGSENASLLLKIEVEEFTCLCPLTGQPDYGRIEVQYAANKLCVESKSLKLYLMGFRQFGGFHEQIVTRIGTDLVCLLAPHDLSVYGEFKPRGGIAFKPRYTYMDL